MFLLNSKNQPIKYRILTLVYQQIIIIGFFLFILLTSSPFNYLYPAPAEGLGLNPILQDPALAIHPPILYLGYVGSSIIFSASLAATTQNYISKAWAKNIKIWILISWIFLTIGILVGSIWAYYELGWGGWWFWDPVENMAFVPWLVSVALIHSLITSEKRGLYRNWSLLLSILAFATSLLGTFLVRSGILTSVHAFALDPERGVFILAIFFYFICGSLLIYFFKNSKIREEATYNILSKEFGFLLNNILLVVLALSILFGTIFPLIYEAINGRQISVGAPYFDFLIIPFALGLSFLQGLGLYLGWHSTKSFNFLIRLLVETFTIMIIIFLVLYFLFGEGNFYLLLSILAFSWILSGTILDKPFNSKTSKEIRDFLYYRAEVIFAHLGTAFLILGVGVVSAYSMETEVLLAPGEEFKLGDSKFTFKEIKTRKEQNYNSTQARLSVSTNNSSYDLITEKRYYPFANQMMTEAGIKTLITKDFYVTLGDELGEKYSFRLQIKPFVRWIWFGALMVAIGTFLSAYRQRKRNEKIT